MLLLNWKQDGGGEEVSFPHPPHPQILWITQPDKWSPQATFAATRIFASNLNAKLAQRFYATVLLPAVLDNIDRYKCAIPAGVRRRKLNYHLYQALKKAMYKPAAFFKGIVIPLCEVSVTAAREA